MDETGRWLRWWRDGFVQGIDKSWHRLPWFCLPDADRKSLIEVNPRVSTLFNISDHLITAPDARALNFIALSRSQQQAVFALLGCVCNGDFSGLTESDREWGERIQKGIRPQIFLPQGFDYRQTDKALFLLKAVLSPGCWYRLRLQFPEPAVLSAENISETQAITILQRLRTLWDAAIWRIAEHE